MHPSPAITSRFKTNTAKVARVSATVAILASSASAFAQQPPGKDKSGGSSWGLGLAAISAQKAYKGMDRETRPCR